MVAELFKLNDAEILPISVRHNGKQGVKDTGYTRIERAGHAAPPSRPARLSTAQHGNVPANERSPGETRSLTEAFPSG
ncbi:hypothetical protein [Galactobacter caseinivorans]|uniref:Uncharacterized protein n=1 Tax=Galactobacter caseinivorans TaxID=2676123 RepID=A0A496PKL2_9MICC|nr:hypothetical protein [Galactobacter caseinivorans]RKW70955.1 hypothetical protein DWQ67_03875 [Galactobacter caseinivorans]